jgi:hypothetical protein
MALGDLLLCDFSLDSMFGNCLIFGIDLQQLGWNRRLSNPMSRATHTIAMYNPPGTSRSLWAHANLPFMPIATTALHLRDAEAMSIASMARPTPMRMLHRLAQQSLFVNSHRPIDRQRMAIE